MCLVDGGGVSDLQAVVDCNKHNARRAVVAAIGGESGGFVQVFGSFDASATMDPHMPAAWAYLALSRLRILGCLRLVVCTKLLVVKQRLRQGVHLTVHRNGAEGRYSSPASPYYTQRNQQQSL